MSESLLHLKSGSDVRGVAVAQEGISATLTEPIGSALGVAFAEWIRESTRQDDIRIAVGMDSRVTGEKLKGAMLRGLSSGGATAVDCGLCTTPAMFMSTILMNCDAAVMVTASHLPWQRNGYKFFTRAGGLGGAEIAALLESAATIDPPTGIPPVEKQNLLAAYTKFLMDKIRAALPGEHPLAGQHIVVDAGNGAGGFYADMLKTLGADISGSQFLEPDGRFPNHIPNPEAPEAMESLSRAVIRSNADLGVIFDADCDRAALVGADGRELNRNRLIALVSAMLSREETGITVVTDSVVSAGLGTFLTAHGVTLHRYKRGYRNVIDEAIRLNEQGINCPLAMETSGHAALRENRFLDDGMYLVTRLIIEAQRLRLESKSLEGLIADLKEPVEAAEIRLPIQAKDFRSAGEKILENIHNYVDNDKDFTVDTENREGVRLLLGVPDEWALLRLSVHDPLLVINVESGTVGGVAVLLGRLQAMLKGQQTLDLSALDARLSISS